MPDRATNRSLDLVRGASAIAVVLGHSRFILEKFEGTPSHGPLYQQLLLAPTSFAEESVAIFFLLSGFLVGGQVIRDVSTRRFVWRSYMAKRLSRLWTVLIPGLVLTLSVGSLLAGLPVFSKIWPLDGLNGANFACNVVFLQQSRCTPYGSNISLWSVSYEFWFYMLFAAGTVALSAFLDRSLIKGALYLLLCALVVGIFGVQLLLLIPSWLLGVAISALVRRWKATSAPRWAQGQRSSLCVAAVLLLVGLASSNIVGFAQPTRFVVIGVAAFPLVLLLAYHSPANDSVLLRRVARTGDWSYSTYVFHVVIVEVVVSLLLRPLHLSSLPVAVVVYGVAASTYVVCVGLWAVTERQTGHVRRTFMKILRAPSPKSA